MTNKKFWKDVDRYIDNLKAEINSNESDRVGMLFWLFKIERRFRILKEYIEKIKEK